MMTMIDISKYSNSEKILLAEALWDSIDKEKITVTEEIKDEIDNRINLLQEGKTELYSYEDIKKKLAKLRK